MSPGPRRKFRAINWECVSFQGVSTLTDVNGNINDQNHLQTIDDYTCICSVIAQNFAENNYIFLDDKANVHCAKIVKDCMIDNHINTTK